MIIRNNAGMARKINGQLVRPNRTVEVPDNYVIGLYDEIVSGSVVKEEVKEKLKPSNCISELDLNGDGVFDEKDKSIAAKVLATKRKYKK